MKLLMILNRRPYDGSDVVWNALRLAEAALGDRHQVRIFLMNDAVDIARVCDPPMGAEFDVTKMLQEAVKRGAQLKLCTTCVTRCGIGHGALIPEAELGKMADLVAWIAEAERVVSF